MTGSKWTKASFIEFVTLLEDLPCLWKTSHLYYRRPRNTQVAYKKIQRKFSTLFSGGLVGRVDIDAKIQQLIQHFSKLHRLKKSAGKDSLSSYWWADEYLTFLKGEVEDDDSMQRDAHVYIKTETDDSWSKLLFHDSEKDASVLTGVKSCEISNRLANNQPESAGEYRSSKPEQNNNYHKKPVQVAKKRGRPRIYGEKDAKNRQNLAKFAELVEEKLKKLPVELHLPIGNKIMEVLEYPEKFLGNSVNSVPKKDDGMRVGPTQLFPTSPPKSGDLQKLEIHPKKPPYSYNQLIGQALLSAPDLRLTLRDIYKYVCQKYPYYKWDDKSWKNALRHSLTISSHFRNIKKENLKSIKNFWTIEPSCRQRFKVNAFKESRWLKSVMKRSKQTRLGSSTTPLKIVVSTRRGTVDFYKVLSDLCADTRPNNSNSRPTDIKNDSDDLRQRLNKESADTLDKMRSPPSNPYKKPSYSFVELIYQALDSSPSKRLTLQDICSYISGTYPFYHAAHPRWHNSVSYNLAVSDRFVKDIDTTRGLTYWKRDPDYKPIVTSDDDVVKYPELFGGRRLKAKASSSSSTVGEDSSLKYPSAINSTPNKREITINDSGQVPLERRLDKNFLDREKSPESFNTGFLNISEQTEEENYEDWGITVEPEDSPCEIVKMEIVEDLYNREELVVDIHEEFMEYEEAF